MLNGEVLLTDCDLPSDDAERLLRDAGLTVVRPTSTDRDALVAAGARATAVLVQWATIDDDLLARLPHVTMVSRLGIGYDMIDVDAATARGIAVANTPDYCIEEVATHTTAMILAESRGLAAYDRRVRAGDWRALDGSPMAVRPSTTTVAVIGFGRIGSLVASQLRGIGFDVVVADPFVDAQRVAEAGYRSATPAEALAAADIVTLHVPLTADTRHMLDAAAIGTMRPGAVVVNTCRGGLVDEAALADALAGGRLAAAALDVFGEEPLAQHSRLRDLPNVRLSPHAAWYSPESLIDLPINAARNIIEYLQTGSCRSVLNGVNAAARVSA